MPFEIDRQRGCPMSKLPVQASGTVPSDPHQNPNHLLAALPPADYKRITSALEVIPLELKQVLHEPGARIAHVYFPGSGFCSIVTVLEDGRQVEVATVGREGMAGVSAVLDESPISYATMVQGEADTCFRMRVD